MNTPFSSYFLRIFPLLIQETETIKYNVLVDSDF